MSITMFARRSGKEVETGFNENQRTSSADEAPYVNDPPGSWYQIEARICG